MATVTGQDEEGPVLARHEGAVLFTAGQAILKGLLEADMAVSLLAGPVEGGLADLFRRAGEARTAELLRKHDLRVVAVPDAARGLTLAAQATASGAASVAWVPGGQLARCLEALRRAAGQQPASGGALTVLLEDCPAEGVEPEPRRVAATLNLPCLEPAELAELRDQVEISLRVSRVGMRPTVLLVHSLLLRSLDTFEARPNRVLDSVGAILARRRRRRRARFTESEDVLRVLRRVELNEAVTLPNPGERVAAGFITVGAADRALRHLIYVLGLGGRIPQLRLGVTHPVDESVVARLLGRCDNVVVLEPRPGVVEAEVVRAAEAMRQRGQRAAMVWGRTLPENAEGMRERLGVDEALHPSILVRRIMHLLHRVRPRVRVGSLLAAVGGPIEPAPPAREEVIGPVPALAVVRRVLREVDHWLSEQWDAESEPPMPITSLAIDGAQPTSSADRVVEAEVWTIRRLMEEGVPALRHAAREGRPWVFVVLDMDMEDRPDPVRFIEGLIPAEQADRLELETADLADLSQVEEKLRAAALGDGLTVVVVHDGPPARYDVPAVERELAAIDRLGFEPRQRVVWPVTQACAVREPLREAVADRSAVPQRPPLRSAFRVDRLPRRVPTRFRFRLRPMFEQTEVMRQQAPARRWPEEESMRLALPEIVHRHAAHWRVHVAGYRGAGPGVAARVLCEAGRRMGYAVRCVHDPAAIAAGRRAWAQILFTRPREGEVPPPLTAAIPFGEADVLLGLDATETLRALAVDRNLLVASAGRTYPVVNLGLLSDERDTEQGREMRSRLEGILRERSSVHLGLMEDFAAVCRGWFHTDRVADMVLLGAAYQCGLLPLTLDALEAAVSGAQSSGFGRCLEAFRFGRRLACDQRLFSRPRQGREDDLERLTRFCTRLVGRGGRLGAARVARFRSLLIESLQAMPGMTETELGRQAARDFVMAMYRCYRWGQLPCAERYARLITGLYRIDRGDTGRALTRSAVLPVADALLIRDPIFIASMATSGEHRRRIRRTLNVKRARADQLERRFLTRVELFAFGRRYRADVRTSDWPARLALGLGTVVPQRWRGIQRERELRRRVVELADRGAKSPREYERYQRLFGHLHQLSRQDRLHGLSAAELNVMAAGAGVIIQR